MLKNVIIPTKIGQYYVLSKSIVSIEISPISISGLLIQFKNKQAIIKKKIVVALKDFSAQTVIAAIKKITTTIGSFDEIVTGLSSSIIVFKELELPFIGREKLEMIINYEVEALLPFSLHEAVIDFIVMHEDVEKNSSRVLIAAARREDVLQQVAFFEKAGVNLSALRVDMFALYNLYRFGIHKEVSKLKKKDSLVHEKAHLLVDIAFDVMRILYFVGGKLKAVRIVPHGVSDIVQVIADKTEQSFYDVAQELLQANSHAYVQDINKEMMPLFDIVKKTLSFFEQQPHIDYKKPHTIIFSGVGCALSDFITKAQDFFDMPVHQMQMSQIAKDMDIKIASKVQLQATDSLTLAVGLLDKYDDTVNLLAGVDKDSDALLFNKQIITIVLLTTLSIGGVFWNSYSILEEWNIAYNRSKKELASKIKQTMHIDVSREKNLKNMVKTAEDTLKKERKLWFSFSKRTEVSYLEYLQELSTKIDRASLGLDLRKMYMDYEKVRLTGSLKNFESLEVFEEELSELSLFEVVDKPRELSFSIELKVKDRDIYGTT